MPLSHSSRFDRNRRSSRARSRGIVRLRWFILALCAGEWWAWGEVLGVGLVVGLTCTILLHLFK